MSGKSSDAPSPSAPPGRPASAQRPAVQLFAFDEPCPYLKGPIATFQGFFASSLDPGLYRSLMDHHFRRSGRFFYRPQCAGCGECVPLRVVIDEFTPSRSQRRCWSRNSAVMVEVAKPELTAEKADLYREYQLKKHGREDEKDMGAVRDFLYNPVVETLEFAYRDPGGKLLAVGICDVFQDALSSVYCFYDVAEARRGLGTFTALYEIGYAKRLRMPYYYLGYLVSGCEAMRYKASFRPYELLDASGVWHRAAQMLPNSEQRGSEGVKN